AAAVACQPRARAAGGHADAAIPTALFPRWAYGASARHSQAGLRPPPSRPPELFWWLRTAWKKPVGRDAGGHRPFAMGRTQTGPWLGLDEVRLARLHAGIHEIGRPDVVAATQGEDKGEGWPSPGSKFARSGLPACTVEPCVHEQPLLEYSGMR